MAETTGEKILALIHDDITWCMDSNCPVVCCMRNQKNVMDRSGLHSYADFRNTDECMIYQMERDADIERGES